MREILFRGKRGTDGKWIHGYLYVHPDGCHSIITSNGVNKNTYRVIKETVGQYTGMTDRKGVKIFEGDVVSYSYKVNTRAHTTARMGQVIFSDQCFLPLTFCDSETVFVIGNIHDNPGLLEVENG